MVISLYVNINKTGNKVSYIPTHKQIISVNLYYKYSDMFRC
jgi:hypothetical protein